MEQIRLGKNNLKVTRLGFGGIPIQRVSEEDAIAVVKSVVDSGITFIDTAHGYTTSEERIGKAIAGQRDKVILATKSPSRTGDGVRGDLKLSLEHLQTDYIDLYQLHGVSDSEKLKAVLAPGGPLAVAEKAKSDGVVKHIGVSTHSMDIAKELVKMDFVETLMFPFNFMAHEAADELLDLARENDVGFIAMKPLAGGVLGYVNLAMKYLCQFSDVEILVGMEQISEIEELISIVDNPPTITAAELQEIEKLREEMGTKFCRRCNYCQPCQQEVPISSIMIFPSMLKRFTTAQLYENETGTRGMMERAEKCIQCGECEERCPYHLPIREMMTEHLALYKEERAKYLASL